MRVKKKESYSLYAHDDRFLTDQQCFEYLVQVRWNGIPQCPKCGNNKMNYFLKSRNIYKCSNCRKQFSVTQGTIFERSKIPLKKWFKAIYFFTTMKGGVSSCQLAELLEVQQRTAWFLLHRLREAAKEENNIILSGIVEADETLFGPKVSRDKRLQWQKWDHEKKQEAIHGLSDARKRRLNGPKKQGRQKGYTKEMWEQAKREREAKGDKIPFERCTVIFGMVERGGRIVMKILGKSRRNITRENIFPIMEKHIAIGSTVITDESSIYIGMSYKHFRVNHKKSFVTKDGIHSNSIENAWKQLGKIIRGTYCNVSYRHFDKYLDENTFRWNRRKGTKKFLFDSFFSLVTEKRITYKKLISRNSDKIAA